MTNIQPAVIITGGGRGLGRTIAGVLAKTFSVLIVGRTESDLIVSCKMIHEMGGVAEYLVADVKDPESAPEALNKLATLKWTPAALICNAGIGKSSKTHEVTTDTWHDIINTNLSGSFYFSKAVLPVFMSQGMGVICFVSSLAGIEGFAYEAAYTASKHAQVGLSKSIAKEYGKYGIRSVAICPGFIEGEMTERTIHGVMKRRAMSYEEARDVVAGKNPQKRILSPDEVANTIQYICSDLTPSLSGNPIILSGGA